MGERRVIVEWMSLHQDYLQFAFDSVCAARESAPRTAAVVRAPLRRVWVDRAALEGVRYSYDALEAGVKFVLHGIELGAGTLARDDTWLRRFVIRKFRDMALGDKLGLVSWAWGDREFWQSEGEWKLFEDLKKLRNGLTHPRPVGRQSRHEILEKKEADDIKLTVSRQLEEKLINAEVFVNKSGIASFTEDPTRLCPEDAEKAFEIALLHLARLEEVTLGPHSGWFDIFDEDAGTTRSPPDLLRRLPRHFADVWPSAD